MGSRRYSCARIVSRKAVGFGLSSGVGALGIHQAAAVAAGREDFRPAVTDRAALRGRKAKRHALRKAVPQEKPQEAPGQEKAASACPAGGGGMEDRWVGYKTG